MHCTLYGVYTVHRIIRVYSLLAVLLDPIVHVFLENTVYGVYTVHRIIRVYSMLSKEKGPYGATMRSAPWPCPARRRWLCLLCSLPPLGPLVSFCLQRLAIKSLDHFGPHNVPATAAGAAPEHRGRHSNWSGVLGKGPCCTLVPRTCCMSCCACELLPFTCCHIHLRSVQQITG